MQVYEVWLRFAMWRDCEQIAGPLTRRFLNPPHFFGDRPVARKRSGILAVGFQAAGRGSSPGRRDIRLGDSPRFPRSSKPRIDARSAGKTLPGRGISGILGPRLLADVTP